MITAVQLFVIQTCATRHAEDGADARCIGGSHPHACSLHMPRERLAPRACKPSHDVSGITADLEHVRACAHMCRHAAAVALVCHGMIGSGGSRAVAEITAALVDGGALTLACDAKAELVALGEQAAGCPCHELVK